MKNIIYSKESYNILGACFEVYNKMGNGFLESVYQECLEIEFKLRNIPFVAQKPLKIQYKNHQLQQTYKPDFICYDKIILEIKAVSQLTEEFYAQILNYLKLTGYKLGILANFGHYPNLEYKRIAL